MRETLDAALTELFGGTATPRRQPEPALAAAAAEPSTPDSRLSTLVQEARRHYEAAIQAQRDLDWAKYGEEMRQLGELLERLGSGGTTR
jgi:uncharacterized protein